MTNAGAMIMFLLLLSVLLTVQTFPSVFSNNKTVLTSSNLRDLQTSEPSLWSNYTIYNYDYNYNNHQSTTTKSSRSRRKLTASFSPVLFMQVVAGTDTSGYSGDSGPATSALIRGRTPWVDTSGAIYIPDSENYRVRKVKNGIISTFGGTGTVGTSGTAGPITSVQFSYPYSIVGDTQNALLYICDERYVWQYIFSVGQAVIYAQSTSLIPGFGGDGAAATSAQLKTPRGLWLTTSGVLYVADYDNHRIRKIATNNIITTVVGSGCSDSCPGAFVGDNGPATSANLNHPRIGYVDTLGRMFIADYGNHRIRFVDTNSIITTFAGLGGTAFNGDNLPALSANIDPVDVKGDTIGNIFISDNSNCLMRIIDNSGIVSTIFGTPTVCGFTEGIPPSRFTPIGQPVGHWMDTGGNLIFSDFNSIRKNVFVSSPTSQPSGQPSRDPTGQPSSHPTQVISPNLFMQLVAGSATPGFSGDTGPATSAQIQGLGLWVAPDGSFFVPDYTNYRVRRVSVSGIITTFAGTGTQSATAAGNGGDRLSVSFNMPDTIVGDASGSVLYISDERYVWKFIVGSNIMTVYAQSTSLGTGFAGDNGPATSAQLSNPRGLWLTTDGVLYIADYLNHRIRKVSASGIITTVVGSGCVGCTGSFSGENVAATTALMYRPSGIFMDTNGRLFIVDSNNNRIRLVDANSIITTFAGTGTASPFNGEGIPATSANLNSPGDVKGDSLGNIYIADKQNYIVRMVDSRRVITTVFGNPGAAGFSPGISDRSGGLYQIFSLWIDTAATVYFSDLNSIHKGVMVASPSSQPSGQPSRDPTGQPSSHPTSLLSPNLFMSLVAGSATNGLSGDNNPATSAQINGLGMWVAADGSMYIPDYTNYRVRKVSTTGIITTYAGTGSQSTTAAGNGGNRLAVSFYLPDTIVGDAAGTVLYISDEYYVWKYTVATSVMAVFAQSTGLPPSFTGDGGPATSAQLSTPRGLWLTTDGVLYIADYTNHRIRKVSIVGIITTVVGSGCSNPCAGSFSGENVAATTALLWRPIGIYMDTNGRLFIADSSNNRIRLVDANNIITTFAATSANLNSPSDVKGDSLGNIYIADRSNSIVRMVDSRRVITTVFGTAGATGFSPGISDRSANLFISSLCG
jgi:sugar lactone lactonase YvrE